jgi:hypothetical protein
VLSALIHKTTWKVQQSALTEKEKRPKAGEFSSLRRSRTLSTFEAIGLTRCFLPEGRGREKKADYQKVSNHHGQVRKWLVRYLVRGDWRERWGKRRLTRSWLLGEIFTLIIRPEETNIQNSALSRPQLYGVLSVELVTLVTKSFGVGFDHVYFATDGNLM